MRRYKLAGWSENVKMTNVLEMKGMMRSAVKCEQVVCEDNFRGVLRIGEKGMIFELSSRGRVV